MCPNCKNIMYIGSIFFPYGFKPKVLENGTLTLVAASLMYITFM